MPSTVAEILTAAGAESAGVAPWGVQLALPEEPLGFATGIYVVSLTDHPGSVVGSRFVAPISVAAVDKLLDVRPELTLDGQRPNREQLAARLAGFWLPDEVVVYIGLAGQRASRPRQGEVARRVEEYYKTPLGARTPHAGGWPLKTLVSLSDLYVDYAYCRDVEMAEDACIRYFADHVSDATRERPLRPRAGDAVRQPGVAEGKLEEPRYPWRPRPHSHQPRQARDRNAAPAGGEILTRLITTGDLAKVCGPSAPPVPEGHVERHRGRARPHPHRAD